MTHAVVRPADTTGRLPEWHRRLAAHVRRDLLAAVPADRRTRVQERVNELTRPRLEREGRWVADYRRLRFMAVKLASDLPARAPGEPCG